MTLPKVRYISPANLKIGDAIRVTYPENENGIVTTLAGKVAKRDYTDAGFRIYTTVKGGVLVAWHPEHKYPARITLLDRRELESQMLDGMEISS